MSFTRCSVSRLGGLKPGTLTALQRAAQPLERGAQDPRHVHLRAADPLGDLRLGEVAGESHGDHPLFPLGQLIEQRSHQQDGVDVIVRALLVAERRREGDVVVVHAGHRGIERQRPHGVVGGEGLLDLRPAAGEVLGQIGDGGQVPQLLGQQVGGRPDP